MEFGTTKVTPPDKHHAAEGPLVSVIMPSYNSENYVIEAIESVLAQTYEHWELLVIDDASNDKSVAIVRDYEQRDPRIHLLFNDNPIKMPSAPRNVGIKAARGRFIAFLDSDDVWYPQKLEQQIPLFDDERVAIAYANYEKMDEAGRRKNRIVSAPAYATYSTLLKGNVIGNLTGVYDRQKVGDITVRNIHHEDYEMWLTILKRGFLACNTCTTLAGYRVRSSSISSRKLRVCLWQWDIYRNVEHLSMLQSAYYFSFYALKAFWKSLT